MDDKTFNMLRHIRQSDKIKNLIRKGRYIRRDNYNELKKQKYCDYCHKEIINEIPEIHHIIAIRNGGTNMRDNLIVVHKRCHKILDSRDV